MNWYRLSQGIKNKKEMGMSYYDIGHCNPNFEICVDEKHRVKNSKVYLWWWENGELKFEQADKEGKKIHMDILGDDTLKYFQGRVQITPEKKLVSIAVPDNFVFRPIPEQITEALQREFGYDIEIVRFD